MSTPRGRIELEHVYAHPPAAVWRALTDPALHAKWWAAGDVKAVVGHRFELDMGAFGKQPCEVTRVEPQRTLAYRFSTGLLETTLTWTLTAEGTGTRLTLVHEGFDLDSPMGKRAFEGMKPGWPTVLVRMEATLSAA